MLDFTLPHELADAVTRFVQHDNVIVASDFDGVLAPIVLNPMDATALPGTIDSLRELSAMDGVSAAVVSGRDLATLRQLTGLRDGEDVVLIGSHGAQSSVPVLGAAHDLNDAQRAAWQQAHQLLTDVVAQFPQARIEEKPAGVVLHTRGMADSDAEAASAMVARAADELPGVHPMRGKSVVELSVTQASKGAALAALREQVGADAVAYFGDDVTDETVFARLADDPRHLCVKVGDGETAAALRVPDPDAVRGVLAQLARARGEARH